MKIGIATFYSSINYGAVLQAYALSTFLVSEGHAVTFINYDGIPQSRPCFKWAGFHPSDIIQKRKINDFSVFRKKYMPPESVAVLSCEDAALKLPRFDAYICGSDQIWNPELCRNAQLDPFFFLQFAPKDALKISYAASMGSLDLPKHAWGDLRIYSNNLNYISMRENAASDFLKGILQKECKTVLDPVFLPSDYQRLISSGSGSLGGILCYFLQRNDDIFEVARKLSKHENKKILNVYGSAKFWTSPGRSVRPSPNEWVSLINDADIFLTNSFHGVALSILLEKDFVCLPASGEMMKRSGRIDQLLEICGLQYKMAKDLSLPSVLDARRRAIDWKAVRRILSPIQESSRSFLRNALRG